MRKRISPETISAVLRLNREGNSYSSIAKRCGLDQRTAKSIVQRELERKGQEHWEQVFRQADAKLLSDHHRQLLLVAAGIRRYLKLNDPNSIVRGSGLLERLDDYVVSALGEAGDIFAARGLDQADDELASFLAALGPDLRQKLCQEHEPELGKALGTWQQQAHELGGILAAFKKQARVLLTNAGLAKQMVEELHGLVEWEAAESLLLGKQRLSSRLEKVEGQSVFVRHEGTQRRRTVYEGSAADVAAVRPAYERTLTGLADWHKLPEARRTLQAIGDSAAQVEGILRQMVARGRPLGDCSACPGRPASQVGVVTGRDNSPDQAVRVDGRSMNKKGARS